MPPTRTFPPAKAIKTERTHEENQERAYIAASRRSDRSLEARVESARRASEIHKRRTGRSLRVTEQDVINEEMYEEEDDDLPLQYRRLTAHLQTGSADFNRRLAAYLTNQVAMRSAMGQMVNNSYAQQYANNYMPQQRQNMFQSPMMPQPMAQSPTSMYRSAPYPSPHNPNFRQTHGRAYSTAVLPNNTDTPSTPSMSQQSTEQRRMSTPATLHTASHNVDGENNANSDPSRQTQSAVLPTGQFPPLWQDMGPFTTTLPPESQQLLAGAPGMDLNDPFNAMLMHGSESFMTNPYYPWGDMQHGIKGMPVHPSAYPGMSATLAPSALDSNTESLSATPSSNTNLTHDSSAPSTGLDFNFSQESKGLGLHASMNSFMTRENSHQGLGSGQLTPTGEGFWDNFVQDNQWGDDST